MSEIEKAFNNYASHPLIIQAIERSAESTELLRALIRTAFMEGAKYATDRCEAEGHHRS